ncbi:septum site-determining protein MinC [Clostridium polynesiense]|uniref:septum site-determining protein MinC n=1 Tax=Clostridium polynesiense TaxID=1325933 RepID=UPI00058CDF02|nr:septum site-determining protein MinC [Clostridium polynesiense]
MIDNRIIIKGNKEGLIAVINMYKFKDFDDMLEVLIEKLSNGKKFFKGATLTININLKLIDEPQMKKLKHVLFEECLIKDCIFVDKDDAANKMFNGVHEGRTKFITKTVRGGQAINYPGNVVIIGDVNSGAEVHAEGNIVVVGTLKGQVYAGSSGNKKAFISAYSLQPEILQIADIITISPEDETMPEYPEVAKIKDGVIVVEPYLPNKYNY